MITSSRECPNSTSALLISDTNTNRLLSTTGSCLHKVFVAVAFQLVVKALKYNKTRTHCIRKEETVCKEKSEN